MKMKKKNKFPKIKERRALHQINDLLTQRKLYLNENFHKKLKGSFTELELLETFIRPFIKPILKLNQDDCPVEIGDKFYLKYDNTKKEYIVASFPYDLTVSGVSATYEFGSPLSITCYYKDCVKIEPPKNKKKSKKKNKKKSKRKSKRRLL